MTDTVKRIAWTFVQAFLATFLAGATGFLAVPNLQEAKAAAAALVVASLAAGASAVKNLVFPTTSVIR